jgi:hypothetical protein
MYLLFVLDSIIDGWIMRVNLTMLKLMACMFENDGFQLLGLLSELLVEIELYNILLNGARMYYESAVTIKE